MFGSESVNVMQQSVFCWSTKSQLTTLLSCLISRLWVSLELYYGSDLSIDGRVGPDVIFGQAHRI